MGFAHFLWGLPVSRPLCHARRTGRFSTTDRVFDAAVRVCAALIQMHPEGMQFRMTSGVPEGFEKTTVLKSDQTNQMGLIMQVRLSPLLQGAPPALVLYLPLPGLMISRRERAPC